MRETLTNTPGYVPEPVRALRRTDYLIGRLRTPHQWVRAFTRRHGRRPGKRDIDPYRFVADNLAKNRRQLQEQLQADGQEEDATGACTADA